MCVRVCGAEAPFPFFPALTGGFARAGKKGNGASHEKGWAIAHALNGGVGWWILIRLYPSRIKGVLVLHECAGVP